MLSQVHANQDSNSTLLQYDNRQPSHYKDLRIHHHRIKCPSLQCSKNFAHARSSRGPQLYETSPPRLGIRMVNPCRSSNKFISLLNRTSGRPSSLYSVLEIKELVKFTPELIFHLRYLNRILFITKSNFQRE